jgi:hypothetical protein
MFYLKRRHTRLISCVFVLSIAREYVADAHGVSLLLLFVVSVKCMTLVRWAADISFNNLNVFQIVTNHNAVLTK